MRRAVETGWRDEERGGKMRREVEKRGKRGREVEGG